MVCVGLSLFRLLVRPLACGRFNDDPRDSPRLMRPSRTVSVRTALSPSTFLAGLGRTKRVNCRASFQLERYCRLGSDRVARRMVSVTQTAHHRIPFCRLHPPPSEGSSSISFPSIHESVITVSASARVRKAVVVALGETRGWVSNPHRCAGIGKYHPSPFLELSWVICKSASLND